MDLCVPLPPAVTRCNVKCCKAPAAVTLGLSRCEHHNADTNHKQAYYRFGKVAMPFLHECIFIWRLSSQAEKPQIVKTVAQWCFVYNIKDTEHRTNWNVVEVLALVEIYRQLFAYAEDDDADRSVLSYGARCFAFLPSDGVPNNVKGLKSIIAAKPWPSPSANNKPEVRKRGVPAAEKQHSKKARRQIRAVETIDAELPQPVAPAVIEPAPAAQLPAVPIEAHEAFVSGLLADSGIDILEFLDSLPEGDSESSSEVPHA